MSYNIADFESLIRSYLVTQIQTKYPTLDVTENSVFDDLYIKPAIVSMQSLIDNTNTVDVMGDLSNAGVMSDEVLESIGLNNYGLRRNGGTKATAILSIAYTRIPDKDDTVIPLGTIFSTPTGLQFQTVQKYSFTTAEMTSNYNASTLLYIANISVTAFAVGTEYNVPAGQITIYPQTLSAYIDYISNAESITNGVDKESNTAYAARLASYYVSRYLGTSPGYKEEIKSLLSGVSDVYVAGKGDALMTRDEVSVTVGGTPKVIHMGGKTDIYLKGSVYEHRNVSLDVHSGRCKLSVPYAEITLNTVAVTNTTQPGLTVSFSVVNVSGTAYVVIANTAGTSYSKTAVDSIRIAYTTTASVATVDTFQCGLTTAIFDVPFQSMVSLVDVDDPSKTYTDTSYTLIRKNLDGDTITSESPYYQSTQERVSIVFTDGNEVVNDANLLCTYSVNASTAVLYANYEIEKNRLTTADVIFKEAAQHPVNIALQIKLRDSYALDDTKKTQIQSAVSEYINRLTIGESIKESDVVSAVYDDNTIMQYLYYIKLPLISFYEPANITDALAETHDANSYITPAGNAYIALNKFAVTAIS